MTVDPSVTGALERAVEAEPGNAALRLHLASLLVVAGDPARALEHAQAVLALEPDSAEALATARDAARALGDTTRADGYARLLGLSEPPTEAPPLPPLDAGPIALPAGDGDELDADDAYESPERPVVTLADVGGLEHVKARLEAAFLAPLRDPQLRRYYGKSLRGGLM